MQIHELTKRRKQVDEGILDGLKAAVNVAKTGADKVASAMVPGYNDVKAGVQAYKQGGMAGLGKALINTGALNKAKDQVLQKQSQKGLADLRNRTDGEQINAKTPLSFFIDQVKQDPQAAQQRQALDTEFTKDFELGPALPDDANHVLTVQTQNGGIYYKDIKGTWFNEQGKALPPTSSKSLDDLIDADQYSQVATPPALQKAPAAPAKGTGGAAALNKAAATAPATQPSATAAAIKEARTATQPGQLAQRAKQRNTPAAPVNTQTTAGSELQKAAMAGSQATQAVGDTRSELQKAAAPGSQAQQQIAQDPNKAAKPGAPLTPAQQQPATTGQKPKRAQGKKKLRKDFDAWISQSVPDYSKIANDGEVDKTLKQIFSQLLASKNDPKAAAQLFDKYVLTIQAGIARAKAGAQGEPGATDVQNSTTDDELARLRGQPAKKTGNKELDNILTQAGIQLSESQVYITKDIRVKSPEGDYVKKAEDQQWYDPNGMLIDPTKYSEYIKKLDATPAAQTRYQADSKKGFGTDKNATNNKSQTIEPAKSINIDIRYYPTIKYNGQPYAYNNNQWYPAEYKFWDDKFLPYDPEADAEINSIIATSNDPKIDEIKQKIYDFRSEQTASRLSAQQKFSTDPSELRQRYYLRKDHEADRANTRREIQKNKHWIMKESQVYITKDIHVKTPKGDYIKRHEDQEWYAPNGVRIDPEKYPEYIKKLDATPQAQTRYQSDAEKGFGSDEGVKKAQQAKANAPTPKIELPKATAADWEEYKANQNRINNQMIDKTVNDLRNAEYFKTGQEQYLQQQLAQLMAKKF